jgi:LmbE family N-acetylglucosaminyl deacetylase
MGSGTLDRAGHGIRSLGLMLRLALGRRDAPVRVLAIGAHPDDIEIGCAGTLLRLIDEGEISEVCWVVLSGSDQRAAEAQASADSLLADIGCQILLCGFDDGFFPYDGRAIKEVFERLKRDFSPDLIFTHQRRDLHQDHRVTCELTWNTFRDHLVLEYEVPKYDGDMGRPNLFVPLEEAFCRQKIDHLMTAFPTQVPKRWFKEDLFSGLMRLRGMECNSPTSYAEAFYSRKAVMG